MWNRIAWIGIAGWKWPSDMRNYQEILVGVEPSLVFEFGNCRETSAMLCTKLFHKSANHSKRPAYTLAKQSSSRRRDPIQIPS